MYNTEIYKKWDTPKTPNRVGIILKFLIFFDIKKETIICQL